MTQIEPEPGLTAQWYYHQNEQVLGPYSGLELRAMIMSGQLPTNTLVWRDGWGDWRPFESVQQHFVLEQQAAPPAAGLGPAGSPVPPGGLTPEVFQEQWYYNLNGWTHGPIDRPGLRVVLQNNPGASLHVWRQGMTQWVAVGVLQDLLWPDMPPPPPPVPMEMLRRQKQLNTNVWTMLICFVILAVLSLFTYGQGFGQRIFTNFLCWVAVPAAIFSVIYLPLRWRDIRLLPEKQRYMALVGGLGNILISLMLLYLAATK